MTTRAPERLTGDASALWRRQSDCGCYVVGGGMVNDPLRVVHCDTHAATPALLAGLQEIAHELWTLRQTSGWTAKWDNIDGGTWAGPAVHTAEDIARALLRAVDTTPAPAMLPAAVDNPVPTLGGGYDGTLQSNDPR